MALQGPRDVDKDRGRDLDVARIRATTDRAEACSSGSPLHRTEKAGLPDPGLAGEQQEAAAAGRDLGDPAVGQGQQVVPADQDRADEEAMVVHCGEFR